MISKFFGLLGMLVSTYRYDGDNEHHLKLAKGTVPEQSTTTRVAYLSTSNPKSIRAKTCKRIKERKEINEYTA